MSKERAEGGAAQPSPGPWRVIGLALTLVGVAFSGYVLSLGVDHARWPAAPQPVQWSALEGVASGVRLACEGSSASFSVVDKTRVWRRCDWRASAEGAPTQGFGRLDAATGEGHLGWVVPVGLPVVELLGAIPAGEGEVTFIWATTKQAGYEVPSLVVGVAGAQGWRWAPQRLPAEGAWYFGMAWRDGETLEVVQRVALSKEEEERALRLGVDTEGGEPLQELAEERVPWIRRDLEIVTLGAAGVQGRRPLGLSAALRYDLEPGEPEPSLLQPEVAYFHQRPRSGKEEGFTPEWKAVLSVEKAGLPSDMSRRRLLELGEAGSVVPVAVPRCQTSVAWFSPCVFSPASGVLPRPALETPLEMLSVALDGGYSLVSMRTPLAPSAGGTPFFQSWSFRFGEPVEAEPRFSFLEGQSLLSANGRRVLLAERERPEGQDELVIQELSRLGVAEAKWIAPARGFSRLDVLMIELEAGQGYSIVSDSASNGSIIRLNRSLEPVAEVSLWQHLASGGANDAEERRSGYVPGFWFLGLGGFVLGPLGWALGVWSERRGGKARLRWRRMTLGAGLFLWGVWVCWQVLERELWVLELL